MTAQEIKTLISGLKEAIDEFNKAAKEGKDGSSVFEKNLDSLFKTANNFTGAMGDTARALDSFSKLSISNSNSFGGLVDVIESGEMAVKKLSAAIGGMPIFGEILKPFSQTFERVSEGIRVAAQAGENFAKVYDGMDKGTRENIATQFKYAAALGMTFDQAEKNNEAFNNLIAANSEFARVGTYFGGEDFRKGIESLQQAGISMEELSRASGVSSRGMNNMQVMTLQAKAMGMDISDYSRKMADMIRKTGLSTEDSMKMMAGAQELSSETGLRLDEVTQSLEGVVSGFQRMGTTMDFGRPILKGFAQSVKEVGLGIEQAKDLSSEFSKSLLGIVNKNCSLRKISFHL
jgi:methyl-accepting chemotaxis protein